MRTMLQASVVCLTVLSFQLLSPHAWGWTPPALIDASATSDTLHEHSSVAATDGGGTYVSAWLRGNDFVVARSGDNGQSWSAPQTLDFQQQIPAPGSFTPSVASDGLQTWAVTWAHSDTSEIRVALSTDGAQSWSAPVTLNSQSAVASTNLYPQVAADGAGSWIVVWQFRDLDAREEIYFSRSDDGGTSWSEAAPLPVPKPEGTLRRTPEIASGGSGVWVATWVQSPMRQVFSRSTDNGLSWSDAVVLGEPSGIPSVASLANDEQGNWVAVWTQQFLINQGPLPQLFRDVVMTHSHDNGLSWASAQRMQIRYPGFSPKVVTNGMGSWILATTSDTQNTFALSTDQGVSWARPAAFEFPMSFEDLAMGVDDQILWVGTACAADKDADIYYSLGTPACIEAADLALSMEVSSSEVVLGDDFCYTLTVTNDGPDAAQNVKLTAVPPELIRFVSVTASQGSAIVTDGKMTAELGSLTAGTTATVTIVANASGTPSYLPYTIVNGATVSSPNDSNEENNRASATITVYKEADVKLSLSAPAAPVMVGHPVELFYTVTNTGPETAGLVAVRVTVSEEATFGTSTDPQVAILYSSYLAPGESATLSTPFPVALKPGTLKVEAKVLLQQLDPRPEDNAAAAEVQIVAGPDLTAQVTSFSQKCRTTRKGQMCSISASVEITNSGPVDAGSFETNIYVSDTDSVLPGRSKLVSKIRTRRMAANSSRTVSVRRRLPKGMTARFVIIETDARQQVVEMNEANNTVVHGPVN